MIPVTCYSKQSCYIFIACITLLIITLMGLSFDQFNVNSTMKFNDVLTEFYSSKGLAKASTNGVTNTPTTETPTLSPIVEVPTASPTKRPTTKRRNIYISYLHCHMDGFWSEISYIGNELYASYAMNMTWVLPKMGIHDQPYGEVIGTYGPNPFSWYIEPDSTIDWIDKDDFDQLPGPVFNIIIPPFADPKDDLCSICPYQLCNMINGNCNTGKETLDPTKYEVRNFQLPRRPKTIEELSEMLQPIRDMNLENIKISIPFKDIPRIYYEYVYFYEVKKEMYPIEWKFITEHLKLAPHIVQAGNIILDRWGMKFDDTCKENSKKITIGIHVRDGHLYQYNNWKISDQELTNAIKNALACVKFNRDDHTTAGLPWQSNLERDIIQNETFGSRENICNQANGHELQIILISIPKFIDTHKRRISSLYPCAKIYDFKSVNYFEMAKLVNFPQLSHSVVSSLVESYVMTRTDAFVGSLSSMSAALIWYRENTKFKCKSSCSYQGMKGTLLHLYKNCLASDNQKKQLVSAFGKEKYEELFHRR